MDATIYMVRCADGSYYVGLTRRLVEDRVREHNHAPGDSYCARRRPVELVFAEAHTRMDEAVARERQIKGWSRAKKERLIAGDHDGLVPLAKRRGGKRMERGHPRPSRPPSGAPQDEGWETGS